MKSLRPSHHLCLPVNSYFHFSMQIQKEHTQDSPHWNRREIKITFALLYMLSDEDDINVKRVLIMKRKEASVSVYHL